MVADIVYMACTSFMTVILRSTLIGVCVVAVKVNDPFDISIVLRFSPMQLKMHENAHVASLTHFIRAYSNGVY